MLWVGLEIYSLVLLPVLALLLGLLRCDQVAAAGSCSHSPSSPWQTVYPSNLGPKETFLP